MHVYTHIHVTCYVYAHPADRTDLSDKLEVGRLMHGEDAVQQRMVGDAVVEVMTAHEITCEGGGGKKPLTQ